jgi:hypothetical protein
MRPLDCAPGLASVLAVMLLVAAPARAGSIDSSACKRDLTSASAGVSETKARLKGLAKTRAEEKCAAYRAQFLVVVKARAVVANCKTGSDRDEEVGRLDGTIEDLNGGIAESCAVQ